MQVDLSSKEISGAFTCAGLRLWQYHHTPASASTPTTPPATPAIIPTGAPELEDGVSTLPPVDEGVTTASVQLPAVQLRPLGHEKEPEQEFPIPLILLVVRA